jgi:hypothetical protein
MRGIIIAQSLTRFKSAEARSCQANSRASALRIKAELMLKTGGPEAASTAEGHFRQALEWARLQGVLSLELRCATGLSRLWHERDQDDPARALLQPIYLTFRVARSQRRWVRRATGRPRFVGASCAIFAATGRHCAPACPHF